MDTAAHAIAVLDRQLARKGSDAVLRRYSGSGEAATAVDVTVRASARRYQPQEVAGGVIEGRTMLVISPTQILAEGWPDPQGWPAPGDWIVWQGREQRIAAAPRIEMDGTAVRIDLEVEG